jgi:hypothetical protein
MVKVQERAEATRALRILLGDVMMRSIARSRRFRVVANERVAAAPPDRAGRRLRGIDLVDYASDRAVTARVDLDRGDVASLRCIPATTTFLPVEEADAIAVALADRRVARSLLLGDTPRRFVHVGAPHRSVAVTFGAPSGPPSLIAVVDLARRTVTRILPGGAAD